MNVFELVAKLTLDSSEYEQSLTNSKEKTGGLKNALSALGGGAAVAVAAATTAAVALGKASLEGYAEYEQLVGGVETLFKDSAGIIQEYAANAYQTAGLSANEYMETVTSFSASLLQSLGGDTEKAAQYADKAITDMSDNANKMGSSMESIQTAYQGFAKQNYTMLDNLKLGYGGTKSEMERLILDAEQLDSSFKASRDTNGDLAMSYSDIVDAIHIVQTDMGITGTTAKEASTTIQGSLQSTKAAWSNLVVGIADENANLEELVGNFVESVVTTGQNILPRIEIILQGMSQMLSQAGTTFIPLIVDAIVSNLPSLIQAGVQLVVTLAGALVQALPQLIAAVPQIISSIVSGLQSGWPQIQQAGQQIIQQLGNTIKGLASQALQWGKDLISNFINGVKSKLSAVGEAFSSVAQKAAGFIHFSEPDEGPLSNFHTFAPDMMQMFAKGIIDNGDLVGDAFDKALDIGKPTLGNVPVGGSGGNFGSMARELVVNVTEVIDGSVLARNQYKFNLEEADRHGGNLINAYA